MSPAISIIVSFYNSEETLTRCLDSIKNQSFEKFEVLMLNDGSSDNSKHISLQYAEMDNRFRYLEHENMGVSKTRDKGIKNAKGEFLMFVDSDDDIEPDTLKTVIDLQHKTGVDIVSFSFNYIKDGKTTKKYNVFPKNQVIHRDDFIELLRTDFPNKKQLLWFSTLNLIKRRLVVDNQIVHEPKLRTGVDSIFNLQCYLNCNGIYAIDNAFYNYRFNSSSLTQRPYKPNFLENINLQFKRKKDILGSFGLSDELILKDLARYYLQHSLFYLIQNEHNSPKGLSRDSLKRIRNTEVFDFGCRHYAYSKYFPVRRKLLVFLFKNNHLRLLTSILNWKNK